MAVKDDEEDADEADEHVNDGEDSVNVDVGVDEGEVIDGGDESVPWEEVAEADGEVDDIG